MLVGGAAHAPANHVLLPAQVRPRRTSRARLPRRDPGLLAEPADWNASQQYTIPFGQGLSLNAMQAASVYSDDRQRRCAHAAQPRPGQPPRPDGRFTAAGARGRRGSSPDRRRRGSRDAGVRRRRRRAPRTEARIPGYRVAGKTGTANRDDAETGRYSRQDGLVHRLRPGRRPELVVAVTSSDRSRATSVASSRAPVFQDVMTYALQELQIPPTGTTTPAHRSSSKTPAAVHVLRTSGGPAHPRSPAPPTSLAQATARAGRRPLRPRPDVAVTGITHDSRAVRPGDLYAALPGRPPPRRRLRRRGRRPGAVAVLTDPAGAERGPRRRRRPGAGRRAAPRALGDSPRSFYGRPGRDCC